MQTASAAPRKNLRLPIEDYSTILSRYQSLSLSVRAKAVLKDTNPAIQAAEDILQRLADDERLQLALSNIRKNHALMGKVRASDARDALMDSQQDFIAITRQKLAAWCKTMQRLSQGEGIVTENNQEFIPQNAPLASAIAGTACASNYLSMVHLILSELTRIEGTYSDHYASLVMETRRCSTVLSDYENASNISGSVH